MHVISLVMYFDVTHIYYRVTNGDMHYPLKLSLNSNSCRDGASSTSSSTAGLSPQTPVTPLRGAPPPLPPHIHVCTVLFSSLLCHVCSCNNKFQLLNYSDSFG